MNFYRVTNLILIGSTLLSLSLAMGQQTLAQEGTWSEPVNISNSLTASWFPALTVDTVGRIHVVWTGSVRDQDGNYNDSLLYTVWNGNSWSQPNDVATPPREGEGAYTLRPVITVNRSDELYLLYRYPSIFHFMRAPADTAWSAQSWSDPHRISGGESEWADMAIDSEGTIHVIWSEDVPYILPGGMSVLEPGNALFSKADDFQTTHLAGDNITDIAVDAAGNRWIATDKGFSIISANGNQKSDYTLSDGLASEKVQRILIDKTGNKWLATQNGVNVLDDKSTPFDKSDDTWVTYTAADGLVSNNALDIAVDSTGQIWFATDKGLSVFSETDQRWETYTEADGLASNFVQTIFIDQTGYKWFGTRRGISVLNDKKTPFDKSDDNWITYTYEEGLESSRVLAIRGDNRGRKWFSTSSGLSLLEDGGTPFNASNNVWTTYTTHDGLPDDQVTDLAIDDNGILWIGTANGVSAFSPDNERQLSYTIDDGLAQSFITAVAIGQNGDILLGTQKGERQYISSDVFYRHSADGGQTWSSPQNLSQSRSPILNSLRLHVDAQDVIHAVWDEIPSCGYISSSNNGETWSKSTTLYAKTGSPRQAVVGVDNEGNVVIVWRMTLAGAGGDEELLIYYQLSADGGSSWSEPAVIPNLLARALNDTPYDAYDMAVDSAGHLHLLVIGRTNSTELLPSVLHIEWDGKRWSAPTKLFSATDPPERPAITVSRGNKLHVAWFVRAREDQFAGGGDYQVWYAQGQSDAPHSTPPPTLPPPPTPTLVPTQTPMPTSTPYPTLAPGTSDLPTGLRTESDELLQLATALLPLVLLVVLIMAIRLWK